MARLLTTTTPVGKLVARYMSQAYLEAHWPVFSSKTFNHVTFVVPSATIPSGQQLVCQEKCNAMLNVVILRQNKVRNGAKVTCSGCSSHVTIPLPRIGYTIPRHMEDQFFSVPGHIMVQTPYPIPVENNLQWCTPAPKTDTTNGCTDPIVINPANSSDSREHTPLATPTVDVGDSRPPQQKSPVWSEKGTQNSLPRSPFDMVGPDDGEHSSSGGRVEGVVARPSCGTTSQSPGQQQASNSVVGSTSTKEADDGTGVNNPPRKLPPLSLSTFMSAAN